MKAVGYTRRSKDKQALSPEAQRAAIEAWAQRTGVEIVAWHFDDITGSARLDKRLGLLDAIADLKPHGATILAVANRTRLARDVFAAATIEQLCRKAGATVRSADGVGAEDTPESRMFMQMLDVFAEYELALIRGRTRAALRVKSRRGERVGSIPFGKRLEDDGVRLAVCDRETAIVAEARRLHAAGESLGDIGRRLTADGMTPRTGRSWHPEQIRRMVAQGA